MLGDSTGIAVVVAVQVLAPIVAAIGSFFSWLYEFERGKMEKIKLNKFHKCVLIISLILSIVFCLISFTAKNTAAKPNADNLIEYEATVTNVEIFKNNNQNYTILHTKEFDDKVTIMNNNQVINMQDLYNIKSGDKIKFTIDTSLTRDIDNANFVNVVTLSANDKILISLESTLNQINQAANKTQNIGIIITSILFLIFLISLILAIVKKRRNIIRSNV